MGVSFTPKPFPTLWRAVACDLCSGALFGPGLLTNYPHPSAMQEYSLEPCFGQKTSIDSQSVITGLVGRQLALIPQYSWDGHDALLGGQYCWIYFDLKEDVCEM